MIKIINLFSTWPQQESHAMPYFQQKFTFSTQNWIQQHPNQDPWERTYIRLALLQQNIIWNYVMRMWWNSIQNSNSWQNSQDFKCKVICLDCISVYFYLPFQGRYQTLPLGPISSICHEKNRFYNCIFLSEIWKVKCWIVNNSNGTIIIINLK